MHVILLGNKSFKTHSGSSARDSDRVPPAVKVNLTLVGLENQGTKEERQRQPSWEEEKCV